MAGPRAIHGGFHDVYAIGASAAFEEYLVAMHRYPAEHRATRAV